LDGSIGLTVYDDNFKKFKWNPKWIPIALDKTGNILGLNVNPNDEEESVPYGFYMLGGVFTYYHDEKRVEAPDMTFREWLGDLLNYITDIYSPAD